MCYYSQDEIAERKAEGLYLWYVSTFFGVRGWWAMDKDHAIDQHNDAFGDEGPDERIIEVWQHKD